MRNKNVLIVGNSIFAQALAKRLVQRDECDKVYLLGSMLKCPVEGINIVDIRENNSEEILGFALQNAIDLTVVASEKALNTDIVEFFTANGQQIFAPDEECTKSLLDYGLMKKLLYKLRIKTTKFGVFEKSQPANEYIKTANFPVVIRSCTRHSERDMFACPTNSVADIAINDLFLKNENKIIISEYRSGHRFNFYIITDGYKVLPIGLTSLEIFSDCIDGGFITDGMASFTPDNLVDIEMQNYILNSIVMPIIENFEICAHPYVGFMCVTCVKHGNEIFVENISPIVSEIDAGMLLATIDENLFDILEACTIGSFADDYNLINTNSNAMVSVALYSRSENSVIDGLEMLDEPTNINLLTKFYNGKYYTHKGIIGTIYAQANTLSRAKTILAQEISNLKVDGLKYRKDICNSICNCY